MADGNLVIRPEEARSRAQEMVKIAADLEDLLNTVSAKMEEIDNQETGIYQNENSSSRPAELRAQLDEFRGIFNRAYEQIRKSADDIIKISYRVEEE